MVAADRVCRKLAKSSTALLTAGSAADRLVLASSVTKAEPRGGGVVVLGRLSLAKITFLGTRRTADSH